MYMRITNSDIKKEFPSLRRVNTPALFAHYMAPCRSQNTPTLLTTSGIFFWNVVPHCPLDLHTGNPFWNSFLLACYHGTPPSSPWLFMFFVLVSFPISLPSSRNVCRLPSLCGIRPCPESACLRWIGSFLCKQTVSLAFYFSPLHILILLWRGYFLIGSRALVDIFKYCWAAWHWLVCRTRLPVELRFLPSLRPAGAGG